jgi:hypothetical protein
MERFQLVMACLSLWAVRPSHRPRRRRLHFQPSADAPCRTLPGRVRETGAKHRSPAQRSRYDAQKPYRPGLVASPGPATLAMSLGRPRVALNPTVRTSIAATHEIHLASLCPECATKQAAACSLFRQAKISFPLLPGDASPKGRPLAPSATLRAASKPCTMPRAWRMLAPKQRGDSGAARPAKGSRRCLTKVHVRT